MKSEQSWFGECNAFDTAWYYHETINNVMHVLKVWFEGVRGLDLVSFEEAKQCVATLNPYPVCSCHSDDGVVPNVSQPRIISRANDADD
ncbi:hypothetical protein K9F10_12595 [Staphylococcus pseudintermedius]|nr:hypothetical protein K9F10_12595 [Staphylococcus pseudintermedius]